MPLTIVLYVDRGGTFEATHVVDIFGAIHQRELSTSGNFIWGYSTLVHTPEGCVVKCPYATCHTPMGCEGVIVVSACGPKLGV